MSRQGTMSTSAVFSSRSLFWSLERWAPSVMFNVWCRTAPSTMADVRILRPRRHRSARCTTSRTTSTTACRSRAQSLSASLTRVQAKRPSLRPTRAFCPASPARSGMRRATSCLTQRQRPRRRTRVLDGLLDFFGEGRVATFADCVRWARLRFEEYFANKIKQLVFTCPQVGLAFLRADVR